MHSIAIVIPNYKRPELLERLLNSISKVNLPVSLSGIWVVENGGKAGAESICAKYNQQFPVHYVFAEMANLSNARNLGAQHADSDFVIFFDDDLRCDTNTLTYYDEMIQAYGYDRFYGGPLDIDYEKKPPGWMMRYLPYSVQGLDLGDKPESFEKPVFLGGNHAVPRQKLLEIGGYDLHSASSEGGAGGEEERLQVKLLSEGLIASYHPGAKVWHFVPEDRCSVNWALNRHYRYGLTVGIFDAKAKQKDGPLVFGAPRWLWMQYLRLKAKVLFSTFIHVFDQEARFKLRYEAAKVKGIVDGYKQEWGSSQA